jgi:cytochrome c oxidase cbb3-type subunit 3
MNRYPIGLSMAGIVAVFLLTGCYVHLPGQPTEAERWRAPADVSDFNQLYSQNCAGCHGAGGKLGAAVALNDTLYQSFVSDDALHQVIANGRPGTNMPAYSQHLGGSLTDQQIEILISGMRAQWSRPDDFKGVTLPPYSTNGTASSSPADTASANGDTVIASRTGDALQGAAAYQTYCSRCHGTDGGGGPAGSIVDPNFLNLVSNQGLRTTVVVGRTDLRKPDWRSDLPGHPMSPQEIDDVVAWVAAHRKPTSVAAIGGSQLSRSNPK